MSDVTTEKTEKKDTPNPTSDPVALLTGQVGSLTSERDGWKAKHDALEAKLKGQPTEHAAEIQRLKGKIRERDHMDAFRGKAVEGGVREDAVEALWKLTGYEPGEVDTPDVTRISALVAEGKGKYPYLYGEAAKAAEDAGTPATQAAGLGQGRGKSSPPAGKLRVTKEQLADPAYVFEHQAMIREAKAAGNLVIA